MIKPEAMNRLGIPWDNEIMPIALRQVNRALAAGADEAEMRGNLERLAVNPQSFRGDEILGQVAETILRLYPEGLVFLPRAKPAPWKKWGDISLEETAIQQMRKASWLPVAKRGALMPDAHMGYGLPIGGALAVKNAVIPYAVGVDIACRMRLTVLDMPVSSLAEKKERLVRAIEEETRFGMGASFEKKDRRDHDIMLADWNASKVTARLREKAWKQLGTSGKGNHFVEFGELYLEKSDLGLPAGHYLALLSHSGSRGVGEEVATHFSELAQRLKPNLPQELKALAWFDLDSSEGREYWDSMQLMGGYASANHELIHKHILENLGAQALAAVENHHNFAWKETFDGEELIVHRKGCTPAGKGVLGIIPGSMGSPGYVVRGKGNGDALNSCSHGAGRKMSRSAAFKTLKEEDLRKILEYAGVELISGSLDESPEVYKDINEVMAAQKDLVDVVARFEPRLVKMAPDDGIGGYAGKRRKAKKA